MKKIILVTDSLFIYKEHEDKLQRSGYDVERLDNPEATEEELCVAIRGKHGYILGGIEHVTEKVIKSADKLEAIAFTGSGYTEYIPAYELATQKGIAISAATGANAQAVAEYTVALILTMIRNLPSLTTKGGLKFYIAHEFSEITVGVIGFGHVGRQVAKIVKSLGFNVIVTSRSTPKISDGDFKFVSLQDNLKNSDVISLHVDKQHGTGIIGRGELSKMKDKVLINVAFPDAVDSQALHTELLNKTLKAAFDAPPHGDFSDVPMGYFLTSNSQTAFNAQAANKRTSDRATNSVINLLTTGNDTDLVNPSYKKYLK